MNKLKGLWEKLESHSGVVAAIIAAIGIVVTLWIASRGKGTSTSQTDSTGTSGSSTALPGSSSSDTQAFLNAIQQWLNFTQGQSYTASAPSGTASTPIPAPQGTVYNMPIIQSLPTIAPTNTQQLPPARYPIATLPSPSTRVISGRLSTIGVMKNV